MRATVEPVTRVKDQEGPCMREVLHRGIEPEWIDYNGHLSEAYYVLLFGFATDAVMDLIGIDEQYRSEQNASLYTVEAHVRYLREVSGDAQVTVRSGVVTAGAKKLHLAHEMVVDGNVVATEEIMALHVAGEPASTAPFPEAIAARIADLGTVAPDWTGRSIKLKQP